MRRFILVLVSVVMIVVSCAEPSAQNESGILVESNIDAITSSGRSSIVYGEPIIREGKGVMLIFRDNGLIPFDVSDDCFYLYYAGDGETIKNGDGDEFNYVLRCPSILAEVYNEAFDKGEAAYQTGNAFWIYARTYIDESISFESRDFNIILPLLLEYKGEKLPYPTAEDYLN